MGKDLRLAKPDKRYEKEYLELISEWREANDPFIPWNLTLDAADFEKVIDTLVSFSRGEGLPPGFVASSAFWLINGEGRILGSIEIRHALNNKLRFRGGHIGYGIRPSERRKGYASKMLALALPICRQMGIDRILITCSKQNTGSVRTILKNGGVLDSEDFDPQSSEFFQRYWITLN